MGSRRGCFLGRQDLQRLHRDGSYKDARKRLSDVQKARGFFMEERKAAAQKARCAPCGQIGHWAGDTSPVASRLGVLQRRRKTTAYTGDDPQPWDLVEQDGYMASLSGDGTVLIPNVKGTVYDIKVSSLVEARPTELQMMKDRELRTICDQWGIQTSGKMADLLNLWRASSAGRLWSSSS